MAAATTDRLQIRSPEGMPAPPEPVAPAPGLDRLEGKHIAFLSNTKPNIDLLLKTYAELLQERYGIRATHERKINAAVGAGPLVKELAGDADAVVTGIADCGGCTAQTARDSVAFEAEKVPTVFVTTTAFEPLALNQVEYSEAQRVRMLVIPHPFESLSADQVKERAGETVDEVVGLLADGAGREIG
ncbi:MAG: hypothetical protein AB7T48_04460 [Solirubrobacterales bacterium]